jgi:hypothetical protein
VRRIWNEPNDESSFGSCKGSDGLSNLGRVAIKEKYNQTDVIDFCSKLFNSREKHRSQSFNRENCRSEIFRGVSHDIVVPLVQSVFCQEIYFICLVPCNVKGGIESPNAEMVGSRVN